MAQYSIKDLENLSGIKAHTIRIWEKRYQLLTPTRTQTNIRYYSDNELKELLNIVILYRNGLKISKIAKLSKKEIETHINDLDIIKTVKENWVNKLLISIIDFNEKAFDSLLNKLILQKGFTDTFEQIVYPFLVKIGVLWQTNKILVSHEHFLSNLIRKKLFVAIDNIHANEHSKHSFLLFLPEGEWHELALLYYYYLLKKHGCKVFYLGQSTPFEEVKEISNKMGKNNMLLFSITTNHTKRKLNEFFNQLKTLKPDYHIFATGLAVKDNLNLLPEKVHFFNNPIEFDSFLKTIS